MMKTAVIFIHGYMGHPDEHKQMMKKFTDLGFATFGIILSGHNQKKLKDVTKEDWKKDCADYIDNILLEYNEVILVGHSMGALLAIYSAIKYEDKITRLILIDPALEYLKMKDGKLLFWPSLFRLPKVLINILKADHISPSRSFSLKTLNEFHKLNKDLSKDIYKVKCPIMIMHGENDVIINIEKIKEIYNNLNLKKKEFVPIKNGSHWFIHSKIAPEYLNKIEEFVK